MDLSCGFFAKQPHNKIYGEWNFEKEAEPGYTRELISCDTWQIMDRTNLEELDVLEHPDVDTMYKALKRTVERIPNNDWLGTRVGNEYKWITFRDGHEMAEALSLGIRHLELCPSIEAEDREWKFMGIISRNRWEWVITHVAGMHQSITTVPLYETLGIQAIKYIINQTKFTTLAMSKEYLAKIAILKLEDTEGKLQTLKNFIMYDEVTPADLEIADKAGIKVYQLQEIIDIGRKLRTEGKIDLTPPSRNDSFVFSYTSGTTGDPKGVKITHKMIMACMYSINIRFKDVPISEKDTYISYLPASHVFEQGLISTSIIYGMKCGFFNGNPLKMIDDMSVLKPTFFATVPRILNRIYGKIMDKMASAGGVKGWLANKAIQTKLDNYKKGLGFKHSIYDALIFSKIQMLLGGNVRAIVTGSAPIDRNVLDLLKICFCCPIGEGYGLTETCASTCLSLMDDPESGVVGGPLVNVKLRLKDVPDMNYLSTDMPPRGEVCVFSPCVMEGYFMNPEKTAESFDGRWFKSGDVGQIEANGALRIIDRAKNIFKLS